MTDKQVIDKLKNDVACKENIINHLAEHNIKLQDQLKRKEQELEKEKTLKDMYFTYYKAKHSDIKGEFFKLKAENKKLKQAIAEIKEIVETCSFTDSNELLLSRIKQILQLISEVEDDRQD